jgi:4-diphosphocytidyl-2-C-methyl-D-erythritol kinase
VTVRRANLRSPAKINLDLRVLHKRLDGFHELRTVFQTISLADRIEIEYEPSRRTALTLEDKLGIPDNLALRAARTVLDATKSRARVHLRLEKRIPMGSGLGGGSSNAAAVLLALPVLAGHPLSLEVLTALGAELGSDVPFFLTGGTAMGLGRGTEFYELPDIAREPILVVSPDLHVATVEAYQALRRGLTFNGLSSSINNFQALVRMLGERHSGGAASAFSANDFETVVFSQYPQIRKMQARLWDLGAAGVRMTGSGSSVFAVFRSKPERARARAMLEGDRVFRGCRIMPAELLSRRGYHGLWRRQLRDHLVPDDMLWPPRSRYVR